MRFVNKAENSAKGGSASGGKFSIKLRMRDCLSGRQASLAVCIYFNREFIRRFRCIIVIGLWFVLFGLGFAEERDLIINAASLNYDRERMMVEASGSVEAVYRGLKITGEHLIYNTASREVYLDKGFDFDFNGISFSGKILKYNLNSEEGKAYMLKVIYERANISGHEAYFTRDIFRLKNAAFDACGLTPPHYHISALGIDLYQKQGWLAAYWGIFWLGSFPSLPVPVYVYDFRAEKRGKKNVMPYPEVGVNDEDGLWISETMSWYLNPDINGKYNIFMAGKRGWGFGFDTFYRLNDDQDVNEEMFTSNYEAPRGVLEYRHYFGEEVKKEPVFSYLNLPTYRRYKLNLKASTRERINYERVTMLPDIMLTYTANNFEGSVQAGRVAEESSAISLDRGNVKGDLSYPFSFGLTPRLTLDASFYGNGTHWLKGLGVVSFSKNINNAVAGEVEYSHFIENRGQSPFNYEKYRFNPQDKIGIRFLFAFTSGRLMFNSSYVVPELKPQEIDYTAGLTLHCFNIDLTYRAMRQEFILGFSLN